MRDLATRARVEQFLAALAESATAPTTVFLVGGATAVLVGWRDTTRDVDLIIKPESDAPQALAKIERGHARDLADVRAMLARELVTPAALRTAFDRKASQLYRYPAVDPDTYRRALDDILRPTPPPT